MKKQIKTLALFCSTAAVIMVSDFAFAQVNRDFKIETVKSKKVNISEVNLLKITGGYVVNGKVSNKSRNYRLAIPGHVDISVMDANGKAINTTSALIHRVNRKSRFARFKQELSKSPVKGNTIRVAHHNAPLGVNGD